MNVAAASAPPEAIADTLNGVWGADTGRAATDRPTYAARKVGRNEVWEITRQAPARLRCYAKWWPSTEMFQRELEGLRIVNTLAARHDWIMAAPIIAADETTGVIVVDEIRGESGAELIARPLRRFRSSMTPARQPDAVNCLAMIRRFLEKLHRVSVPDSSHLVSHGPATVAARINRTADRLRQHASLAHLAVWKAFPLSLQDFRIADEPPLCVLHGDASPGNFLVDGSRLGILDFEDLGVGPACRDFLWLDYCLERFDWMWHYRSAQGLRRVISQPAIDPGFRLLYRLDFLLLHLETIATRNQRDSVLARLSDQLERSQVIRSLRRHCDLIFDTAKRSRTAQAAPSF
jgi:aminoglycoside phosphotransferase (APT) family kinase protein